MLDPTLALVLGLVAGLAVGRGAKWAGVPRGYAWMVVGTVLVAYALVALWLG